MKTIFDSPADVEVTFRFNGTRRTPVADGYRPPTGSGRTI